MLLQKFLQVAAASVLAVSGACIATVAEPTDDGPLASSPMETASSRPNPTGPAAGSESEAAAAPGNPAAVPVAGSSAQPAAGLACTTGPAALVGVPFRRLTRWEYDNTVRDLLGIDTRPASTAFPAEERAHFFDNDAAAATVSPVLAEQYARTAESLAATAVADLPALTGCEAATVNSESCAKAFIARFGKRAFRRPLQADENDRLLSVYRSGAATDAKNGYRLVVTTLLQSAPFLYRTEMGVPVAGRPGLLRLNDYETAARLSYLLWGTTPDDMLLSAAEQKKLSSPEAIVAIAGTMLADPRARASMQNFHAQWLNLGQLRAIEKDAKAFPAFSATTATALSTQAQMTVDEMVWGSRGTLTELFSASYTFANASTAKLQGLTTMSSDKFSRIELDSTRYAGILTMPPLMALLSTPTESSPIARGKFVREHVLCQTLPAPPANVPPAPKANPSATTRERFAQHTTSPECAGCHRLIDPLGFGFENFDAIGKFRDMDNGKPVNAAGELSGTDSDGPFVGAASLSRRLGGSDEVRRCVGDSWFRYAFGRGATTADACTLESLRAHLAQPGNAGTIKGLLLRLVQSDAFLFRAEPLAASKGVAL